MINIIDILKIIDERVRDYRNKKKPIIVDVSNVAKYFNCSLPKVINIDIMYHELEFKFFVIGIIDWCTVHNIVEYRDYFFERFFSTKKCIAVNYADPLIVKLAQKYWCFIISNDTFKDLPEELCDKRWLDAHRISFKIKKWRFIY